MSVFAVLPPVVMLLAAWVVAVGARRLRDEVAALDAARTLWLEARGRPDGLVVDVDSTHRRLDLVLQPVPGANRALGDPQLD